LTPLLRPVTRDAELPLSYGQERLWFLEQFTPGTAAYTIAAALRLAGPLDPTALQHSPSALVARHESLRTTFPVRDGTPYQHIAPPAPVPLPQHDLGGLPPAARAAAVQQRAQAMAAGSFDLPGGPLLRLELLRLGPQEHVLLLATHHAVWDAW